MVGTAAGRANGGGSDAHEPAPSTRSSVARAGLALGPLIALVVLASDGSEAVPGGLDAGGRATAAVALWMAIWWLSEAVPIYATALLPLALFPLLG
ncbi:MAG: SLC13/DASS family transporter, partial [Deltaproteobacteria bacterium]|nr:SLC13/DASS family transporter [Deltaproteobacteria bacterium]